jgi:hypothetical protein
MQSRRLFKATHRAAWRRTQTQVESVADSPEPFAIDVPVPPFYVAEVVADTGHGEDWFHLRARVGREAVDIVFGGL